ncbi:MAG: hypothetical protein ACE5FR_03805 [Rhodospirillales bacterium]
MGAAMIYDPYIRQLADLLIKKHGDAASAVYAAMRAARAFAEDDLEAAEVWLQIGRAVNERLEKDPSGHPVLH